jgi:arginine N-succinyltransferase
MLLQQGFRPTDDVDVFDGGPKLVAETRAIQAIQTSCTAIFHGTVTSDAEGIPAILSNETLDFRACFGRVIVQEQRKVLLSKEVARALKVHKGDWIRYLEGVPHES